MLPIQDGAFRASTSGLRQTARLGIVPLLTDLVSYGNGSMAFAAWIPVSRQQIDSGMNVTVKANVVDFAGNEKMEWISIKKPEKPAPPPQQPSLPIEWIGAGVVIVLILAGLFVVLRRRS